MADLCDCLDHKSAIVEELEDSLLELREERAVAAKAAAKVRHHLAMPCPHEFIASFENGELFSREVDHCEANWS